MNVTDILVLRDGIRLTVAGATAGDRFTVLARVPIVCGDPDAECDEARVVARHEAIYGEDGLTVPRFAGEYDTLICRFEVLLGGEKADGVCYATDVASEVSQWHYDYPVCPLKAINCSASLEDFDELGFGQTSCGPNEAELMVSGPEGAIEYVYNGKTYYFNREVVEKQDAMLIPLGQRGIPAIMRYVNSAFLIGERADEAIVDIVQHPAYDYDFPSAYMSAFNLRTEKGLDYFCACTEFLAERYSREDRKYGWCASYEMGNEVTSQYIWNNAGDMTSAQFMEEYTVVMRLAWLLAKKHYEHFRVFTSFDQYFCGRHVPSEPKRYYGMRECIDAIHICCARDGDFPWNVAFHPYPENLSFPDFWNDREPNFTFDTRRITFKNLEVMPAYLAQPHLLYRGQPRRVILPEQGFNSRNGEKYTEYQGAHGYCLAYQKMKKLGTIDLFLHHNYLDGPWEFGLNLGIRRCLGYDEHNVQIPGERKPICDVIRDMDTPREAIRVAEARAYIGEELFDRIANPQPVLEKLDTSGGGLSIPGQGNRKKGKKATAGTVVTNFDT